MKTVQSLEITDSLIYNELPLIAKRTVRMKTVTRKKKGIAGLFGKKIRFRFHIIQMKYMILIKDNIC